MESRRERSNVDSAGEPNLPVVSLVPERSVEDVLLDPGHPTPLGDLPESLLVSSHRHGRDKAQFCPCQLNNSDAQNGEGEDPQTPP